jgi:hypothetical protein
MVRRYRDIEVFRGGTARMWAEETQERNRFLKEMGLSDKFFDWTRQPHKKRR